MNLIELAHVNDLCSLSDHDYKQFDKRIDFYLHLETLLTRRLPFNGDILDTLNLRNLKLNRSSLKRVDHILTLVKLADDEDYDIADKLMFVRALVCWEAQFSQGLEMVEHIAEYTAYELNAADSLITLGTFKTDSGTLNTLVLSLHSRSLPLVSTLVVTYGAALELSPFELAQCVKRSISLDQTDITEFLLTRCGLVDNKHAVLLLDEAVARSNLHVVCELLNMFEYIETKGLVNVLKYVNLRLAAMHSKWMLVDRVFRLVFDKFKLDLADKLPNNKTLFALCFEFDNQPIYRYMLDKLKEHSQCQEILMSAISEKLKSPQTNPNVFTLIELLLVECSCKRQLYSRVEKNIRACDFDLHSPSTLYLASTTPTTTTTTTTTTNHQHIQQHPWFLKHRLLAKFDIVPQEQRLAYLRQFIELWFERRSTAPGSYVSAASISRYLTLDELVSLVRFHLTYLKSNGFLTPHGFKPTEWMRSVFLLGANSTAANRISTATMNTVTTMSVGGLLDTVREPASLRMLARNVVRHECRSLSNANLSQLGLPVNLIHYLKNANF